MPIRNQAKTLGAATDWKHSSFSLSPLLNPLLFFQTGKVLINLSILIKFSKASLQFLDGIIGSTRTDQIGGRKGLIAMAAGVLGTASDNRTGVFVRFAHPLNPNFSCF